MRPISDICLIAPTGNSCALSHLPAFGASSVSAKARHMSRSILCSSLPDRSRTPSHFLHNPAPKRGRTQKGREPPQSGGGLFITRRQARVPELRVCDNGPATDTHSSLYGVQRMPPAAAVTCKMRVGGGHKRSGVAHASIGGSRGGTGSACPQAVGGTGRRWLAVRSP